MQFFKKIFVLAAVLMFAVSSYAAAAAGLTGIRTSSGAERDRIVFDLTQMPVYHVTLSEDGREVTFDFADTNAAALKRAHAARRVCLLYEARQSFLCDCHDGEGDGL